MQSLLVRNYGSFSWQGKKNGASHGLAPGERIGLFRLPQPFTFFDGLFLGVCDCFSLVGRCFIC